MTTTTSVADRVGELHDYAVDHKEFTFNDIARDLSWDYYQFMDAVRRLRLLFEDDEYTLVCEPQGQNERWVYKWSKGYDEAEFWLKNRTEDGDSRLKTMLAVARSTVRASDGRTIEGRKARRRVKAFSRLVEDLADLDEEAANA